VIVELQYLKEEEEEEDIIHTLQAHLNGQDLIAEQW
jgi:hypothetical protein